MISKINEFRKTMKSLSDLQDKFGDMDLSSINVSDSEDILKNLGIDIEQVEESFQKSFVQKVQLNYVLDSENQEPEYAYSTDSGFDLRSNESFELKSLERRLVPTGLYLDVPERCEIQVRPKSGLAINKGLSVVNTPGTVDYGYTGEIKVILINLSNETHTISKGDKIAQAVVCPVVQGGEIQLNRVQEIKEKDRNSNGFGSTGN